MKTVKLLVALFRDLAIRLLPENKEGEQYGFAFFVHARNVKDIHRKYPFLDILPDFIVEFFARHMWPVVVSEVTGLKSLKTGKEVKGLIIGFAMTAPQMMDDRKLALKKIIDSAILAKKMGVKIIGLGGLTSSLSKGGLDIIKAVDINVTTGHAYTAYTVFSNVERMTKMFTLSKKKLVVAVVGSSGSIGATTSQLLAHGGFQNLLLIDVKRKIKSVENFAKSLEKKISNVKIETSTDMKSLKNADIIVTATNAPEAVVYDKYLKKGAIIVDDAQPSDIAPEVLDNKDVLVIEAGVVHTPHIIKNINFGLKDTYDNFCCMCEIMILAANEWPENYVINRANPELIDKIVKMGEGLGFRLAELQNFKESISHEKIQHIKNVIAQRSE